MANRNEQATATVNLDGKNAADELSRLQTKAKDLTAQMRKLKDLNDKAGYDALQADLKKTNSEMKQLRISAVSVDAVMKNLSGSSLKQLQQAQRALNTEINNTTRNTAEERKQLELKQQQLKLIGAEINKVKTNMQLANTTQQSWLAGAAQGFTKYLGLATAAAAAIAGFGFSFKSAIDSSNDFNQNLANLSSLTGLTGKDLDFLGDAAKQLSVTTTAEGIKITKSADDIVKAFTKVGGQRPELLANKDALMAVTREALILSEAAQIDLDQAILTVSASMNMFNLQGNEAGRITNALAAGSKAGSAEVDYLGTAILKAGTGFQLAGIQFEQSVGIVEAIAPSFVSAEQAGTNLQSFLTKLEAQTNSNFKPSVVGLSSALDNLAAANFNTTQLVKLFGQENIDIAQIMVNNRDAIDNYTTAVTGTNTAVEQAKITTATYKAAQQQEENQIKLNAIALGDVLAPAQLKATQLFNGLITVVINAAKWIQSNSGTIIFLAKSVAVATTALVSYTAAVKLAAFFTAKQGEASAFSVLMTRLKAAAETTATSATLLYQAAVSLLTGNITAAAQSMRLFSLAVAANPIGLAAAAITGGIVAFKLFRNEAEDNVKIVDKTAQIHDKAAQSFANEAAEVKILFEQLKNHNTTQQKRGDIIDTINSKYGTTLKNLTDEKGLIIGIDDAYKNVIESIKKKSLSEAMGDEIKDISKNLFLAQDKLATGIADLNKLENEVKSKQSNFDNASANPFAKNTNLGSGSALSKTTQEIDKKRKEIIELAAFVKQAQADIDKYSAQLVKLDNTINNGSATPPPPSPPGADPEAQKKALAQLQEYSKKVIDQQDKLYRDTLNLKDKNVADVTARYAADIAMAAQFENDVTDIGREWHRVRVGLERNRDEEILRLNAEHENRLRDNLIAAKRDAGLSRDEAYALDVVALNEKLAKEEISTDEYYIRMRTLQQKNIDEGLKLTEDALKKKNDLMAKYGIAPGDTQQSEIAALEADALKDPTIFTTEMLEKAKLKIIEKYAKMRENVESNTQNAIAEKFKEGIAVAQDLVSGFGSYFQSAKDAELDAAGDNEEKKKNIAKHYAGIELGIKIAQTLANVAMGIADVWAKYATNPALAGIFTGLLLTNATAQIGLASAQREKIQGYATGYYVEDQNGTPYNAAMGGAPSTQMVSKPTVFLAGEQGKNFPEMIIDGPTFKRLQINYPEAIAAINRSRTPGFATGKYPTQTTTTTAQIPAEFMSILSALNTQLSKGITANLGWNEIKDKEYTADLIEKSFGTLPTRLN